MANYIPTDDDKISFNLINGNVVSRLSREGRIELPHRQLDIPKDERWNEKQMSAKILQGILNGDSIPTIAKSMEEVVGRNEVSAMRNTRTMVTSAQNQGRLDSYNNLAAQGVIMKKEWEATPDDRTRKSHIDIDGEEQDLDKPFSNKCMFPGDGNGPGEEVWNCRCAMGSHIIGFRRRDGSISRVNYTPDRTSHEDMMEKYKERLRSEKEKLVERIIPTNAEELEEKWGIPVNGLQGDVIKNMDDALTFMQNEFGVDPKEYIAVIDKTNPEGLRNYQAYYSPSTRGIYLHKNYIGKTESLSAETCAHEITHALNGYLSTLETPYHSTYKSSDIANEIVNKVFLENGYRINNRTGLPYKEDVANAITTYGSTNSLEALADSTKVVYIYNEYGRQAPEMPLNIFNEIKRRLNDDING